MRAIGEKHGPSIREVWAANTIEYTYSKADGMCDVLQYCWRV